MNKLYTKIAGSDLKFSRFIKVVSLTSIATLLSSVSPVFSENLVSGGRIATNIKNAGMTYPQSIISVYDDAIGYLGPVNVSNSDYVTVLSTALESKVNASSGYTNFLTSALSEVSDDNLKKAVSTEEKKKQSIISPQLFVRNNLSPQQFNQDGEDSAMMNASDLSQNYLSPEMQRDVSGNKVTFGNNMQVNVSNAVVIGSGAKVFRLNTDDKLAWTVVIGANAEVNRGGSVAIGNDTSITKDAVLAIVLGRYTRAEQKGAIGLGYAANGAGEASIAIGYAAQAKMNGSIAIGSTSQLGSLENDINPNDEAHKDLNRTKALGENSIAIGSEAFTNGEKSLAIGSFAKSDKANSVSIGSEAFANGEKSLAIGSLAKSEMDNAVSIGPEASALGEKSIAIGSLAKSEMEDTISIGAESSTLANKSIAFGMKSQATMDLGVAIGAYSLANVGSGVIGYSPFKQGESGNIDYVWRSTLGAVSVGDNSKSQSRQITGVAAGKEDTDAVNIAQLKDLQNYVDKGWKLSVNGNNGKVVGIDGTVDFAAGSSNLNVTKGEEDNKVTFDLAKEITLDKITAGASTLKATGLVITGGPQITTGGIDAGGKKITNVATGTNGTDAVNFAQLKELAKGWKINTTSEDFTDAIASWEGSIALGSGAKAGGASAIALGTSANVSNAYAIAIGTFTKASAASAIALGWVAEASSENAIALGFRAKASVEDGIALGAQSVANVAAGVLGYDPRTRANSNTNDIAWRSGKGAVSIGSSYITRQIVGVAAGTNDTDAVNVAQMKSLQEYVDKGWKLSVGGENSKSVGVDSAVDFSAGSTNLNITKGKDDDNVKFDLAKEITLDKITAGTNIFDATGLIITGGPQITTGGIDAGGKKITNVATGTDGTDAVNFSQLKELKEQVAASSFVKQEDGTQHITIGKDTGGDKIDIANNENEKRTLTGIKAGALSADSNEAVIGSQLFTTNQNVTTISNNFQTAATNIAATFGGGAEYKDGTWKAPTFTFKTVDDDGEEKDETYHNVAEALSGVGQSFKNVQNKITNQINNVITKVEGESFIQQDKETNRLTIGKDADGDKIDITNNKSEKRILAGIKDGDISKDSNEAVTGSQLFTTNQNVTMVSNNLQTAATNIAATFGGGAEYKDGKWKKPNFRLNAVKEDGTAGEESYTSVAEAFSGVGTSFKNIQNKFTNDINNAITKVEDDSFIQQDKKTNRLTIGAKTEGTEINIANKSGANRIISGVEDAKNNNDAVNKGQFDKGIESVSKDITNKFNDFTQNITHITQQVQGDALSWSESDGAFVAQHGEEKAKSKLKYLLNGDITADSTDAINGSQLYSMSNNLAGYFGSGAGYDEKGEWKAPTFTLKTIKNDGTASEESYNTVEQAFSAVGTSFANIQSKITNEITNEINKTKGDALLWDNEKEAFVAQHGQEKANSKITFLANGDISEKSTDAINGSQLYSVIDSLSRYFGGNAGYQNGEWNVPTFYVSQFKNSGNGDEKTSYNNVAGAFEGVNESMKSINERINNVTQSVSSSGLNWNEEEQAFDARHKDQDGKIKHVANGDISEGSKEAVNGSQLWETNNRVSQVENRVDNIDQKVKDIADTVTNDAVKYDKNEKGEKINKVTLAGVSESDPVVLDNVANGHLSKDSKEAVNGSQLWETNQQMKTVLDDARKYTDERFNSILNNQMSDVINEAKSYTDIKFNALNYSIENARKEARQAAAIGLAVSNLRYNETPGKLSVGFGTGLWRNQSAFAFGAGYTSESGSLLSNISVTNSGGHWGIGAGFNMTLN
ncbi:Vomp family autotransporter [Bartonella tribocorum]|uniref:Surface protein/Bartonella adhesin n=1 Tax=Bartonella tribocorum TaxID=85701 RepID=A0A2M6UVU2_9HYPH|nr:Vomp family autotransporter [Bartonella tribocorum]PIT70322.1 hypothetical protein CER18_00945 [Bartonella tribocorum]